MESALRLDTRTNRTMAPLKLVKEQEGGAGQAMVDGNKNNRTLKRHVSWRPLHTRTHTPSRVSEKSFLLLSFLSQRKTTLL